MTFRRRLLLVRLLLRAPSTKQQLIDIVNTEMGDQGYPGDAGSALKHDLDALKAEYGCQISFRRDLRCYVLDDLGELALLDLPDDSLEALNLLDAIFADGATPPEQRHVRELLDRVLLLLPPYRQRQYRARRASVGLRLLPSRSVDPRLLSQLSQAISQRREVRFDYRDLGDDGPVGRHRVAPYAIGHRPEAPAYLDASLLELSPPRPGLPAPATIQYRLDRILPATLEILEAPVPEQRYTPPSYQLRYRLDAAVARRRDLFIPFLNAAIEHHPDGSATVTATTGNLWQARQFLLRYGDSCEVLEPRELVEIFQATARGLMRIYG